MDLLRLTSFFFSLYAGFVLFADNLFFFFLHLCLRVLHHFFSFSCFLMVMPSLCAAAPFPGSLPNESFESRAHKHTHIVLSVSLFFFCAMLSQQRCSDLLLLRLPFMCACALCTSFEYVLRCSYSDVICESIACTTHLLSGFSCVLYTLNRC